MHAKREKNEAENMKYLPSLLLAAVTELTCWRPSFSSTFSTVSTIQTIIIITTTTIIIIIQQLYIVTT